MGAQGFEARNNSDADGNPAGGYVKGVGMAIVWQNGPLGTGDARIPPNGAFVEDVIQAVVQRIEYYNSSKFSCRANSLAITHLQEALHWLQHRTRDREVRGIEGTLTV